MISPSIMVNDMYQCTNHGKSDYKSIDILDTECEVTTKPC